MNARTALVLSLLAALGSAIACALLLAVLLTMLHLDQSVRARVFLVSVSLVAGVETGYAVYRAWKRSWPR